MNSWKKCPWQLRNFPGYKFVQDSVRTLLLFCSVVVTVNTVINRRGCSFFYLSRGGGDVLFTRVPYIIKIASKLDL
jgi:hypothetical protein